MKRTVARKRTFPYDAAKGNLKMSPNAVKGALVGAGSSLAAWGRAHGYNRTQVSLALHGRRRDGRSAEILRALAREVGR